MVPDQDLSKRFKVFVDEDGMLNLAYFISTVNPEEAARVTEMVKNSILEILNKDPQKIYNGIVDLSPIGETVSYLPEETRKVYSNLIFHKQINKIAFMGQGLFYKVAVNLMLQAKGSGDRVKWFSDKNKALKWLKKK